MKDDSSPGTTQEIAPELWLVRVDEAEDGAQLSRSLLELALDAVHVQPGGESPAPGRLAAQLAERGAPIERTATELGADELSASSLRGGGRRVLALLDGARIESVAVELLGLSPAAAARLECARGACLGLSHGPRGWSLERSNVLDPGGGRVAD